MLLILYGRYATHRLPTTLAKVLHGLDGLGTRLFRPLRTQSYYSPFGKWRTLFSRPHFAAFYVCLLLSYSLHFARKSTLFTRASLRIWHKSNIGSDFFTIHICKLLRKGTTWPWRYGDKVVSASAYTKLLQPLLGMKDTFFTSHNGENTPYTVLQWDS